MAECKTPLGLKYRNRVVDNAELGTPIKIPASPFLEQIGYGTGVAVYMLERSPRVDTIRSPWAIKKLMKKTNNEINNVRLQSEAELLRKLNHPNIVGFRAFTTATDGKSCLAMEALEISLGDMIESRYNSCEDSFPADKILTVGYEIAKGLKYLHHTVHILHGDIKSWNILVSRDFKVIKLCDFGHSLPLTESLELDESKSAHTYIGTQIWNAPEVIFENNPITSAADIWPYGLVLWEMITLTLPHADSEDEESMCEEDITDKTFDDSNFDMDSSHSFLNSMLPTRNRTIGTRPALPLRDFGKEYNRVFEIFYICTLTEYKLRPSAKALVRYFEAYENSKKTKA